MNIFSNKYLKYSLVLIGGILIGWLIFRPSQKNEESHDHSGRGGSGNSMDLLNASPIQIG